MRELAESIISVVSWQSGSGGKRPLIWLSQSSSSPAFNLIFVHPALLCGACQSESGAQGRFKRPEGPGPRAPNPSYTGPTQLDWNRYRITLPVLFLSVLLLLSFHMVSVYFACFCSLCVSNYFGMASFYFDTFVNKFLSLCRCLCLSGHFARRFHYFINACICFATLLFLSVFVFLFIVAINTFCGCFTYFCTFCLLLLFPLWLFCMTLWLTLCLKPSCHCFSSFCVRNKRR